MIKIEIRLLHFHTVTTISIKTAIVPKDKSQNEVNYSIHYF